MKATPADITRPTLTPNATYASLGSKTPQLPGAQIRVFLNGQDDLQIKGCKYVIYDPSNVRTEYIADLLPSQLYHFASCSAYWTVPKDVIPGGKYVIKAFASDAVGNGAEVDYTVVTISKKVQTITFSALKDTNYGTAVALTATASSGLPVSFTSITPAVCTIRTDSTGSFADGIKPSSGNNMNCIVEARQAGDSSYEPAVALQRAFTFTTPAVVIPVVDPKTVKANVNFPTPTKPAIAIIDSAIDTNIAQLKDRVIYEVCIIDFPSCPNGTKYMEGAGAAGLQQPYISQNGFDHGTQMASVAAVTNPNMNIVFIRIIGATSTGTRQVTAESSFLNALAWIKTNAKALNIKAVSMSQGHHNLLNKPTDYCPSTPNTRNAILDLQGMDIPVFLPTGNNRDYVRIDWPACIAESIAIGASNEIGAPMTLGNYDPNLTDFLELGTTTTYVPGGKAIYAQGTSISTAIAASQYLKMVVAKPTLTSKQILDQMRSSAKMGTSVMFTTNRVLDILTALKL